MGGGANSDFTVGSGAMLTLNFTGTQWANMVRGGLHGPGMVTNLGNFAWSGGRIGDVGSGLFDNQGTFNWNGGGYLTGTLQNERTVTIASLTYFDGVDMSLQDGSLVNNFGTIAETAGTLWTTGSPTITNQFGAVYDLQGDVNIQQAYGGNPVFNNAGTFKKSAGTGTSHVSGITFNNTGSVEVDSGTLVIGQFVQGTSPSAHYQFSSGGQAQVSFIWQGANTADGAGLLDAGGSVAADTSATFTSGNFTNGRSWTWAAAPTVTSRSAAALC